MRRTLVLVALVSAFLLAVTPAAFATPPSVTNVSPADGARFTGGFGVSFNVTDPDGVNGGAVTITVGSTVYRPYVAFNGYWVGDGCDSYWVEDNTVGSCSFNVPDPGPGVHTVTIRVPDSLGEVTTVTRTITRTAAITFSGQKPASGGRYLSADRVVVNLSGNAIAASQVVVNVDGTVVPAITQVLVPGTMQVTASTAFASGSHTVTVSAGDGTSAPPAITSWTFTVNPLATPPYVASVSPAAGSTVQGPFTLSYHLTDANGVNGATARVTVDGRTFSGSVAYAGYWTGDSCDTWWVEDRRTADIAFSIPDLTPGSHTFVLEVADDAKDWTVLSTALLRSATLVADSQTPVPDSRNSLVETVSVVLTGAAVDPASATMVLDGGSVPVIVTPIADGATITYAGTVGEGAHTVRVSASDTGGSPPMSTEWSFVVDVSAPTIASVSPADGATVTKADDGIAVRLDDADAVDPSSVVVTLDGSPVTHTFAADATGGWARWSGVLSEGDHTASVVARDVAGNEVTRTWAFTVADAPRFGAVSPSADLAPKDVTLTAAVSDVNAQLDPNVRVVVDGGDVAATLRATGTRSGVVEAQLVGLADGQHTATVYVRDAAGNEATKTWQFTVDALGPVLTSKAPAPGQVLGKHVVNLSAVFNDAGSINPATAKAWIDGTPVAVQAYNDTRWVGDGCDSYELVIVQTLIVSGSYELHDGQHSVRLSATDQFGQTTVEEWQFSVAEYPAITGLRPTAGVHTMDSSVIVSANIADFDGVAATSVSWRRVGESMWQPTASSFANGVVSAQFAFPAGDTSYEFLVTASDIGGLTSTASTSVYVDASGPVFDTGAARPVSGATLTNRNVAVHARFTDSSAIDVSKAAVLVDGQATPFSARHETQWIGDGCDSYEIELLETLVVDASVVLHDGDHTVKVIAADAFGFPASREWAFRVQESPKITDVVPAANGRTLDPSAVVSAKLTDYDGVAATSIEWREANQGRPAGAWSQLSATYDAGSGLIQSTFAFPRNDTRYEFRFTVTDSGGLTTTTTTSVFAASTATQIAAGTDCKSCHTTILQTHPMSNCAACHGDPSGPCSCHGMWYHGADLLDHATVYDHGFEYTGRTCVDCHSHQADVEAQRHASGLDADCASCHEQALTAEHQGLVVEGVQFTCSTCHASADATVTGAIAANDTRCGACHVGVQSAHEQLHETSMGVGSVKVFSSHDYLGEVWTTVNCSMCHASGQLITIHGSDCDACHEGANPRGSFTDWNGSCQQGACHPVIPHAQADVAHNAIGSCEAPCHEPGWGVPLSECDGCHDPATTPPVTTSDAKASYTGTSATINLAAPGVTYTFYRLDGGARTAGKSVTVAAPATGSTSHTLEFWSVNDAGLEETSHKTVTFTIVRDAQAPVTTSNAKSAYIGPATIAFTATDNGTVAGTYWKLDGGATTQGTVVTVPQPSIGDASHQVEFWSVDTLGNEELPHKTVTFTITADVVAPTTTCDAPAYSRVVNMKVNFLASDPAPSSGVAAIYRTLNGSAPYASNYLWIYGQGVFTVQYWAVDKAGNTEAAKTQTIIKDYTPPVTTSNAVEVYTGSASIHLIASDAISGVADTFYTVDGGAQTKGTDVTVSTLGTHTLRFWSTDKAGNTEAAKSVTFTVN